MKEKVVLLQIFSIFILASGCAYANSGDSTLTKTRMEFKFQWFEVFDAHNFGQDQMNTQVGNFNTWGFTVFCGKLPLGPTITNLKGRVGLYETIDGVKYYRSGELNKMLIGMAGRIPIGTVYLGWINEYTFFEIKELGVVSKKRVDRCGVFFGFDVLHERDYKFLNKLFLSGVGEYFKLESPYAPELSINFDMRANVYKFKISKNFSMSPIVGVGIRDNGISLDQYPVASVGLTFNYDKSRQNFLSINYQQRAVSATAENINGVFVEMNIDPYIFFPKFFYEF